MNPESILTHEWADAAYLRTFVLAGEGNTDYPASEGQAAEFVSEQAGITGYFEWNAVAITLPDGRTAYLVEYAYPEG